MICLGHYATEGMTNPAKAKDSADAFEALEISDRTAMLMTKGGKVIEGVVNFLAPYPLRFKEVSLR
jgi:hypothetical protein